MPNRPAVAGRIYLHDGTWEGFLTAVFYAYANKPAPQTVDETGCQQEWGAAYEEIETQNDKAERVIAGMTKRMGELAYEKLWTAFLSDDAEKSRKLYAYIRLGMQVGAGIHTRLYDDRVREVDKLANLVGREAGLLLEFIRFSKLTGGVWYARIDPRYPVLPIVTPHFAERFSVQPFIIHDAAHESAAVFNTREWRIVPARGIALPGLHEDEMQFRRLWRTFYDTVAIKERVNYALRRNHMPKKYWKNIVELTPEEIFQKQEAAARAERENGELPQRIR